MTTDHFVFLWCSAFGVEILHLNDVFSQYFAMKAESKQFVSLSVRSTSRTRALRLLHTVITISVASMAAKICEVMKISLLTMCPFF